MPLLIAEAIGFGILGSYLVTVKGFGVDESAYLKNMKLFTDLDDVGIGMIKGVVFAVIIVLVSCMNGLLVRHGAVDVGRRTTQAVVTSSLGVLISNFFLSVLLNYFFPI